MALTRFHQDNIDLRTRFKTEFADNNPTIRVIWENQPEDHGGDPFPDIDDEFVVVRLRMNGSTQATLSKPRAFRYIGTMTIGIQTEAGQGTKRSEEIADLIGRAMGNVSISSGAADSQGLITRTPRYSQNKGIEDRWYRATLTIPYMSTFNE